MAPTFRSSTIPNSRDSSSSWGYFYKYESALPREVYQFIVLTIAKRSGVAFVWEDHVAAARSAGLDESVINSIAAGAGSFPAPYAVV